MKNLARKIIFYKNGKNNLDNEKVSFDYAV